MSKEMRNKLCPLMIIANHTINDGHYCLYESCAWWIDEYVMPVNSVNITIPGKCAIREIGSSLESMRLDGIPQY